jgi:hypothetical protein
VREGKRVASIEQRVERVEVLVDAHHHVVTELRSDLRGFQQEVRARFIQIDARFVQIDGRFVQLEARFLGLEQKVDTGFAAVRHEMALQFRWLVGLMLTGMATIAAAILAG